MISTKIVIVKRVVLLLILCCVVVFSFTPSTSIAQSTTNLAGIGDSIGEGVQAADAAWQTQVFSYLNFINFQMGSDLSLPLIQTNFLGVVGDTSGRFRIFPEQTTTNNAVSGATVNSLLNNSANATTPDDIDSEIDLILFPRQQSQIESVENLAPEMIICWIGNNDVLSAATSFGNMNASQLTPLVDFERDYVALTDRLGALVADHGTKVVFANIPRVTDIGFLVDRAAAEAMVGFTVNLPDGHYTSVIGVLLMKILGNDNLVNDPDFVLDDTEIETIQSRIEEFNIVIQREAGRIGMPVVDVHAKFTEMIANPPVFLGIPLTHHMLGGLFSLDGVHPSNIGHALLANEFIRTINQSFNMNVPLIADNVLTFLFLFDPSIDKDKDGKATGRLGVGLIETLMFLFGITGDVNDFVKN